MKIDKKSLFLRLSRFAQDIIVFITALVIVNLIGLFLGYDNFITPPQVKEFFLQARESQLTEFQWSLLEKIALLISLFFMYLAFFKLNKFGALLEKKIIFEQLQSILLKKSALYFLIGLNAKTLLLNIVSAVDFLTSQSRMWQFDGSWLTRFLTTFLIFLFINIIADILSKASQLKAENDLTI